MSAFFYHKGSIFDFREGLKWMYIELVEEGSVGEPIRISQSQSGQGEKKVLEGNGCGSWQGGIQWALHCGKAYESLGGKT
jgi:hypothetical protein